MKKVRYRVVQQSNGERMHNSQDGTGSTGGYNHDGGVTLSASMNSAEASKVLIMHQRDEAESIEQVC